MKFLSQEWANAAKEAWNAGPSAEEKAEKLDKYWDWIDEAKQNVDLKLALGVDGLPNGGPDTLVLELEQGVCTAAAVKPRSEATSESAYVLVGTFSDWQEMLAGYDMGRSVMYRKLRLVQGELLHFFRAAFYWTESLACLKNVPTEYA